MAQTVLAAPKMFSEEVAKSFINSHLDVIRWGNQSNHFTWQAGYIMLAMETVGEQQRHARGEDVFFHLDL